MKKLAALLAGAFVLGSVSVASADPINTPIGYALVNEGGYVLLAEGNDDNPGPIAGYVAVYSDRGCADDNGNAAEGGDSPTCLPS